MRNPFLRYAFGAFLVAPLLSGSLVFLETFLSSLYPLAYRDNLGDKLAMAMKVGIFWGIPSGLIFGIIATWPLRHVKPFKVVMTLSGFHLMFALVFFFLGMFCPIPGALGLWVGYAVLLDQVNHSTPRAGGPEQGQNPLSHPES